MRVSIIGDGTMGQAVSRLAPLQGVEVVRLLGRSDNPPRASFQGAWLDSSEVLIDFSTAAAALSNIQKAVAARRPIVIGTTGWQGAVEEARKIVESAGGACLASSNFSIGVQALFVLTRSAGRLLSRLGDFDPFLWEAHHRQKVDAPSGTAIALAERLGESGMSPPRPVSIRAGFMPGTHVVGFDSENETLRLEHVARNRDGFAAGALAAARWLRQRQGFYTMEDMIREALDA